MLQALQFTEFSIMTAITYTIMASASMKTIHKGIIIKKKDEKKSSVLIKLKEECLIFWFVIWKFCDRSNRKITEKFGSMFISFFALEQCDFYDVSQEK